MKTKFLLLSVLTFPIAIFGQAGQPTTMKRFKINEIYFQLGFFSERNAIGTLTDFQSLAPQSILLDNNFAGYSSSNGLSLRTNSMFSVMLGIQFNDKENKTHKTNPLLRLGVSYFSGTTLKEYFHKEDRKTYDTLTNAQTGQTIYFDSVTTKSSGMNYSSEQLRVDASLIFRTNPELRWSLFTGIGITTGISINVYTEINFSQSDWTESRYPNGNGSSSFYSAYSGGDLKKEIVKNKMNSGLSTYIPMGIDFRIGKKIEFWKRTHLFYELRPSINMTSIPELRTVTNAAIQQGLGLKVSW